MIINKTLLLFSVALNVSALSVVGYLTVTRSSPRLQLGATEDYSTNMEQPFVSSEPPSQGPQLKWGQIESTNYLTYVENLRRCGCPEQTIDDIVVSEVNRLYGSKISSARERLFPKYCYWRRARSWSPEVAKEQSDLIREKNIVIKAIIGIDLEDYYHDNLLKFDDLEASLSCLPAAKQRAVKAVELKYRELRSQKNAESNGIVTEEDRVAIYALDQEKNAEIDSLLTVEERFEFRVRSSPLAVAIRTELDDFAPTEAEFRAIYRARAALEGDQESQGNGNPTELFTNSLRVALGEQRFAEYQFSKDPGYRMLVRIADRFGLSRDVMTQVLSLKQEVENQERQIRSLGGLDSSQKEEGLRSLHEQAVASVSNMLGDTALDAYRGYGGFWIDRIGD